MQLAADEIRVTCDGEVFYLRPTLRAALRLERRHGGFDAIVRAVADGNLTVIADVIRESADGLTTVPAFLERVSKGGLHRGLEAIIGPVLDHVLALAGVDASNTDKAKDGPRLTFAKYHEKLFQIGTGFLGWNARDTWDATPAEILSAYNGRIELLKAIFGTSEKTDPTADMSLDDQALMFVASVNSAFAGQIHRGENADPA